MIDWLAMQDPRRVFLETPTGSYTFGEMVESIHYRPASGVEVLRPRLDAGSVVDVLAVMARGTAVLAGPDEETPEVTEANGAVTVISTSGTTGGPKGVRLTRGNWEAAARASQQHLGNDASDVWLLTMGLHRVGGLAVILRTALTGGRVRIVPRFDAREIAAALRTDVTFASLVPTMLQRILEIHPGPYSGVRAVLVGGGLIPDGLLDRASRAGLPVLASYGMTETCGQVATAKPGYAADRRIRPLPGVELRIERDGRIAVRGPMVSPGYVGEPDRTRDAWFITGDFGELEPGGSVRVLGRADDVIVSGGQNINPVVIEDALLGIPGVDQALVCGVPSPEWGMEVACAYAGDLAAAAVEEALRRKLSGALIPKRWLKAESIPLTDLGKPDRGEVIRWFS